MTSLDLEKEIKKGLKIFPTTRYQGSKRRLLPWLYKVFSEIEFESVLDGFGGSASASYLFKLMGKIVHFNDVLRSNYLTGLALIENDSIKLNETDLDFLLKADNPGIPSFIADTFKGIYYYSGENRWLDSIVFNIKNLSGIYEGDALRKKQALAYHSLFQACLCKRPFNLFHRKNLYLRGAKVSRSFGNKKTWDVTFSKLFRKFALEASSRVFSNHHDNKSHCSDILSMAATNYDLIYLDPPYQRPTEIRAKDYFSLYHFLEGLVNYENWPSMIDYSKKHRPIKHKESEFNSLSPLERFGTIFKKFDKSIIAISYGNPGKPTITEIEQLLKKYKKNVSILNMEYSYKLNKKNGSGMQEVLIIGK